MASHDGTLTDEEAMLAMRLNMMRKFGENMKLLFGACDVVLRQEKSYLIEAGHCDEYNGLQNFIAEFDEGPVDKFYPVVRSFFDTHRAQIFSILGNDAWLLNEEVYLLATDGFVDREISESESYIPLGAVYILANDLALEEKRKTKRNMDVINMCGYLRLALVGVCESVSFDQDATKLRAIVRGIRSDLSIKEKDDDNPLNPIVDVFRGFFKGIIPGADVIPSPSMTDFKSFASGAANTLAEHGNLIKDGILGFHSALKEEKDGDISAVLRNLAEKTKNPETSERVSVVTDMLKEKFGNMLPTESQEKEFFSRFLSVFDPKDKKEPTSTSSSSSSSSS